jgi:glycosyltransferase involved in cell wall biosynthesis
MRLTIGLPFYNVRDYLTAALRSIFAQTYQDWELMLVDDGSTDGSSEIARSVRDPRVTVYIDGVNRGLPHRLNQIAEWASGKYLARMDADDMMHPDRLAKQLRFLEENPRVDLVDSATYSIDEMDRPTGMRNTQPLRPTMASALRKCLLLHATVVGKTSWFREHQYRDDMRRAEDFELWCRTVGHSTFARLPEPLYFVREGKVSIEKYLASGVTVREVLRLFGPAAVGCRKTLGLLLRCHLKCWLYRLFGVFGAQEILVQRRNTPLEPAVAAEAARILQQIARTPVPSLSADAATLVFPRESAGRNAERKVA